MIRYGIHSSPFGTCLIGLIDQKVCYLAFVEHESECLKDLQKKWPNTDIIRDDTSTKSYIDSIFYSYSPLPKLYVQGTPFQKKVWCALQAIPTGTTTSYAHIAKQIGHPKAVRAVGTACGKNSVAYLIPCHRVLTSKGTLGGYRWGVKRKQLILSMESVLR